MAPIYDSDIAEERWSADVWKSYELWERVERRLKRKRRIWLVSTAIVFVLLSSIPVLQDSLPKWRSLNASRLLAVAVSDARLLAAKERYPIRLRVDSRDGDVVYRMERVKTCDAAAAETIREVPLFDPSMRERFAPLLPEAARKHGIPGVVQVYCRDPYFDAPGATAPDRLLAFAILPVNDLAEARFDRMSMVLIDPVSGAVSIN